MNVMCAKRKVISPEPARIREVVAGAEAERETGFVRGSGTGTAKVIAATSGRGTTTGTGIMTAVTMTEERTAAKSAITMTAAVADTMTAATATGDMRNADTQRNVVTTIADERTVDTRNADTLRNVGMTIAGALLKGEEDALIRVLLPADIEIHLDLGQDGYK